MLKYFILLSSYIIFPLFKINMFYYLAILFCIFPIINIIVGYISGSRSGFDFVLPILSFILFSFTLIFNFNYTAISYGIVYGCICLVSNLIGAYHKQKFIDSKD